MKFEINDNELAKFVESIVIKTVTTTIDALNLRSNKESESDNGGPALAKEITGYSLSTIYRLSSTGGIPVSRRGNKLIFSRKKLLAWIDEGTKPTTEDLTTEMNNHLAK